jgi:hypothetical protein
MENMREVEKDIAKAAALRKVIKLHMKIKRKVNHCKIVLVKLKAKSSN